MIEANNREESMNDGLISICVPAYNTGAFIGQTMESLCNQTYENIEILVSDNASTDSTPDIVAEWARKDRRVRMLRNKSNIGYVRNVNNVIRQALSDIVAVYHSDDVYHPGIVASEYSVLSGKGNWGGVFTFGRILNSATGSISVPSFDTVYQSLGMSKSDGFLEIDRQRFVALVLKVGNPFSCPTFMTRRAIYDAVGGFTERYPSNEDLELWTKYIMAGHMLAIIERPLFDYRKSESQGSAQYQKSESIPRQFQVLEEIVIPLAAADHALQRSYWKRKADALLALSAKRGTGLQMSVARARTARSAYLYGFLTAKGLHERFPRLYYALLQIARAAGVR